MQRELHQPKRELIVDYVLGLLDSAESQSLERHAANCPDCRDAIRQERQIGAIVRTSLNALPQATHARLMELKPTLPTRQSVWHVWLAGGQRHLAVAMVVVVLFLGLGFTQMHGSWGAVASPAPTAFAMTATATAGPTETPTQIALITTEEVVTITPEMTPVPEMHSQ